MSPTPFADPSHYAVISAMITPAFFLTATGSLLISSNNRLARVVDRMRKEIQHLRETLPGPMRTELELRISLHRRRSYLVLAALRILYAALSAFVGTSIAIAADAFFQYQLGFLPTLLAVLGVLLMLVASLCLGQEARISLRVLERELRAELDKDSSIPQPF